MKKFLAILPALLIFVLLASCEAEPVPYAGAFVSAEPSPPSDYLVTSLREYDEHGATLSDYTYDERGNMLTSYSTEYSWREYQHYLSDELLAQTDFSDLGRMISNLDYTYDDQNRVTKTKSYFFYSHYDYEGTYHEGEPSETVSYREYDGNIVRYREEGSTRVDEVEYDDLGRKVASRCYYDGELSTETTYVYIEGENFITQETHVEYLYEAMRERGGLTYVETRTYDEQGKEIEEIRDYIETSLGSDYYRIEKDYDDAGNLIEERYHNRSGIHWHTKRYTYDEAGRLLTFRQDYITHYSTSLKNSGGGARAVPLTSLIAPPEEFYGYGYDNVYDENGYLVEKIYTTPKDMGVYHSIIYTYDEFGNCVREETRTVGGNLTALIEREFVKRGDAE